MLINASDDTIIDPIPSCHFEEWSGMCNALSKNELKPVFNYLEKRFDKIKENNEATVPSHWYPYHIENIPTSLYPITEYILNNFDCKSMDELYHRGQKAFCLVISHLLGERDPEPWYCIEGSNFQSDINPIVDRVYFKL